MGALRKITANIPEDILTNAQGVTGKGITLTLVEGPMPSRSFPSDSLPFARFALFVAVALSPCTAWTDQDAPDDPVAIPEPASQPAPEPAWAPSATPGEASPPDASPSWALGLNLLEPILYYVGSKNATDGKAIVAPVPVDLHMRLSDAFGIKGTLLYRYFKDGYHLAIHELAIAAGPRLSLTGKGLEGLHCALTAGLGYASGNDYEDRKYSRIDLVLRSELAYAWATAGGVYLVVGAGLLSFFPIKEDPAAISWNKLGKLFQYYQPTINFTVGYAR